MKNKRLLQIVLHNYFTYCLFSIIVCIPTTVYFVIVRALETVKEVYQENFFTPEQFRLEKQRMKGQGML